MDNGSGWLDGGESCSKCMFKNYAYISGYGESDNARIYVRSKTYIAERKNEISKQISSLTDELNKLTSNT